MLRALLDLYQVTPNRSEGCPSHLAPIVVQQEIVGNESAMGISERRQRPCRVPEMRVLDGVEIAERRSHEAEKSAHLLAALPESWTLSGSS